MIRQWNNTEWNFYPDRNSKVDWDGIIAYLNKARLYKKRSTNPLLINLMLEENPRFEFGEVRQLTSTEEPLIQLADLFAGMARFSHEEDIDCTKWAVRQRNRLQSEMQFNQLSKVNEITKTRECRYKLIVELYELCGKHGLYVSIKTRKHLWTRKHSFPVNFWDYEKR